MTVTDVHGNSSVAKIEVTVGNSVPKVYINTKSNRTFFWDNYPLRYNVEVTDKEDKSIDSSRIKFDIDYLPEGKDFAGIILGHQKAPEEKNTVDLPLINNSDCKTCHSLKKRSVGPSFLEVATRYQNNTSAVDLLATKIIKGGGGVWGDHSMSAHPQISKEDAKAMVIYIFSLAEQKKPVQAFKLSGTLALQSHKGKSAEGSYVLSASYKDNGTKVMEPFTGSTNLILRNPKVNGNEFSNLDKFKVWDINVLEALEDGGYFYLNNCDLTDIVKLTYDYSARVTGKLEVHLGGPRGPIVGEISFPSTGSWDNWKSISSKIILTKGIHNLCFVYRREGRGESNLLQIKSIYFHVTP